MKASETRIVEMWLRGLSEEDILEESDGGDIEEIREVLFRECKEYRVAKGGEEYKSILRDLAFSAEDEAVRFRAAKFLMDEEKGRNDKEEKRDIVLVNVNLINERIAAARKALLNSGASSELKIVQNE